MSVMLKGRWRTGYGVSQPLLKTVLEIKCVNSHSKQPHWKTDFQAIPPGRHKSSIGLVTGIVPQIIKTREAEGGA